MRDNGWKQGVAATTAITLGVLAGLVVISSLHGGSQRSELISISASKSSGFKPYKGQMLFTLNDFTSGRVEYPSQNLANGPGPQPAGNGADHAHVMWAKRQNGFRPFTGGQKLFSIEDFDNGRVSFPEEGSRGVRQVVKSTESNIESADHVWDHQVSHGPVEYQDWPLEMPGVGDGLTAAAPSPSFGDKAPTTQLSALAWQSSTVIPTQGKTGSKPAGGGSSEMEPKLSNKLDKMQYQAALSLGKVGDELVREAGAV